MRIKVSTVVLAGGLLALAANAAVVRHDSGTDLVPSGKGFGVRSTEQNATPQLSTRAIGISWHGGPVMTGTPTLYYIFYGTWSSTAKTILTSFASTLGGSPYELVNSTYTGVTGNLSYGGSTSPGYSLGTSLSDSSIRSLVSTAISTGALPKNSNGVYLVLTSADVNETSGFCTQYCGWHTHATISSSDIKYGFVGNTDRCPSACEGFPNNAPNGNTGADGSASIIAHEQEEAISDPDLNAWFDSQGRENADKCAYNYGTTYTAPNGAKANVHLGTRDFLIQQNWNANTGRCALHL
jgi:hypothetical protein